MAKVRDLESELGVRGAIEFFIRFRQSRQALGKDYVTPTSRTRRGMNEHVSAWLSAVEGLPQAHARLQRVEIRNKNASDFIRDYDRTGFLFYCDPPYLHETRVTTNDYEREMSDRSHAVLLATLQNDSACWLSRQEFEQLSGEETFDDIHAAIDVPFEGNFILSGYRGQLYDRWATENGFRSVEIEIDNKASSKKTKAKKIECLWMSY